MKLCCAKGSLLLGFCLVRGRRVTARRAESQ